MDVSVSITGQEAVALKPLSVNRLVVVDVGGLGGLQTIWEPFADQIIPIIFEPNPPQAEALRPSISRFPEGKVIASALADIPSDHTLNIAKSLGCSSLRVPNRAILDGYSIAPAFDVTHRISVSCVRYKDLFDDGSVPAPDAIKVDVQGFEYEVLQGFGSLLNTCLGVQVEAHFYQIYEGQRVFGDSVALMKAHGLVLRRVTPVPHFDGDIVEVDAWFTVGAEREASLNERGRQKLDILLAAWKIAPRSAQFPPSTWG